MKFLREHSIILSPVFVPEGACRDSDDLEVLGLAMASETPVIVTGDQDLLVLNKYKGIRILTPHAFSDMLHNKK
jgi:predicted nucleic acid-binding protein